MLVRQIGFYIDDDGLEIWKLNKLIKLSLYFHSTLTLYNISQSKGILLENKLKILAMANKPSDLCYLIIKGEDAELAHFVLLTYINENFKLSKSILEAASHRGVEDRYNFKLLSEDDFLEPTSLNKNTILSSISEYIMPQSKKDIFLSLFLKREAHSATIMGHMLALPHIISNEISKATIVIVSLKEPVEWAPSRGSVSSIIAIALPINPEIIMPFCSLSKALVDESICKILVNSPPIMKAEILIAILSKSCE